MKKFKDTDNKVHEIGEGFEHLLPVGSVEITQTEADELLMPIPRTAQEIDAEKDAQAAEAAASPALQSAIEEFTALLSSGGINIPSEATIKANVEARIRAKL